MTDPRPYRAERTTVPAEGPAERDEDARSSLPPGAGTKQDDGQRGDVDRAKPYEEAVAPDRMEPQPFGSEDD